jgi:oligosaccharyltransferase complex subunit delta (ribophorin II)
MERPAFLLLRAIKKLAQNNFQVFNNVFLIGHYLISVDKNCLQVPVALTLSSSVAVTSANPKVVLRLSNMFGETVGALSVHIDSATHLASSGVVLSRKQLTRVADDK